MNKRESNYEIMKRQMQKKFSSFNLSHVASEWELKSKDGYLLLTFVGRQYKIDQATGAVLYEQDGILREADYNVCMTLFDILTRKRQHASGILMPVSSFSTMQSSAVASGGLFNRTAQRFDHHDAELSAACRCLAGIPYGKGDVGYLIPVFQDLQAAIQFWNSDEEFAPSLNLFCDSCALDYMHYETMMFMLSHILERLCEIL